MKRHRQTIDRDTFGYMYSRSYSHTWYVHTLLNRLYETGFKTIDKQMVDDILAEILLENEGTFQTFLRLVTPVQAHVLQAIASEGSIKEIQGKTFLDKYRLGAASTVKTAVRLLVEKNCLSKTMASVSCITASLTYGCSRLARMVGSCLTYIK